MSSGLSGTIGTTSAAPMRGCAPSCRRRSIRSRARSTAPSSVSTSSSDSPTSVKAYYEARAPEYDDWWLGTGPFETRNRPGWDEERDALIATLRALPPARTLDVACGTGYLTRHLPGEITGLDQSASMLELASARVPTAGFVQSDALRLPFQDRTFERVFTSHFYGHLEEHERERFLAESRRVAP